jgi:hypothetical protein
MKVDQNRSPNSLEVADENHSINLHQPNGEDTEVSLSYGDGSFLEGLNAFPS